MAKVELKHIHHISSDLNPSNINSKILEISKCEELFLKGPECLKSSWDLNELKDRTKLLMNKKEPLCILPELKKSYLTTPQICLPKRVLNTNLVNNSDTMTLCTVGDSDY